MNQVECVGGSRDGAYIAWNAALEPGDEVPFPLASDHNRTEKYIYLPDGKLHFVKYAPSLTAGMDPKEHMAFLQRLPEVLKKLQPGFDDLERLYAVLPSAKVAPFRVGNWQVSRDDSVFPGDELTQE